MGPKDDVALSFDGTSPGMSIPQHRRPNVNQRPPMRPMGAPMGGPMGGSMGGSMGSSMGGPGGNAGLQFMNFDLGSTSSAAPPRMSYGTSNSGGFGAFEDEAPLLEELGININQITQKTRTVLNPFRVRPDLHEDADLSGPFIFCMLFGLCQLLGGKFHFGIILGWITLASLFLYVVFNLLAGRNGSLDLYRSLSLIGYCLLPMVLFSALYLFVPHGRFITSVLATLTVVWCTRACTSLLVVLYPTADERRTLVAYPCALIFAAFSLLVVF